MPRTATKTTKIAKTTKPVGRRTTVKTAAGEPCFIEQPTAGERLGLLIQAFNWFSAQNGRADAKRYLTTWAETCHPAATVKLLHKVHEREYTTTLGWLARLATTGLTLEDSERARLDAEVARIIALVTPEKEAQPVQTRTNVQEIMRERTAEVGGEIEGMFDDYLTVGNVQPDNVNVVGVLTERNILPQHVPILVKVWTDRRSEIETALEGRDAQLKEGYSNYTKSGLKGLIKFCDSVLTGLQSYVTVKKVAKAPRRKKAVPPERQAAKIRYLKTFKDEAAKLNLESLPPAKLVGASEVFLYDTAKRKLYYYVADDHAGTMSVKGTTILGYDAAKSGVKTVRKPGVTVPALMKAGRPSSRKVFTELATTHAQPNGRTSETTVILKAW